MARRKHKLTEKQEALCRFVESYWDRNGIAPSFGDIAEAFGLTDRSHARQNAAAVIRKGYLQHTPGTSRSLRLTGKWEQLQNRRLDGRSNPAVDEVAENQPELFEGWTDSEWEELRSIRGIGGAMTEETVVQEAEKINENRRIHRLLDQLLAVTATREEVISWIQEKHSQINPRKRMQRK